MAPKKEEITAENSRFQGNLPASGLQSPESAGVLPPIPRPRAGWEKSFEGFGHSAEEQAMVMDFLNHFDNEEWTW